VICVVELTVNDVAAVAPNVTAVAPVKFVPVIVTIVPPAVGPDVGESDVTVGAGTYMNWFAGPVALVPPGVVTLTLTMPKPAGDVAVICVDELTVNDVAAIAPKVTAVAPVRFVPVIVTIVPPAAGPDVGEIEVTDGVCTYVNWSADVIALVPPMVVTVTSTAPVPAGATAVICVAELTANDVAGVAPNETAVAPVKFVPVIVTIVPPAAGPDVGESDVTDGVCTYVNWPAAVIALVPPIVVTVMSRVPVPEGATAVIWVAELTVNDVAGVAPKATAVAPVNSVPVIVTTVPPDWGPFTGAMDVTTGAGTYVNWSAALVELVPPAVVTVTSTVPAPAGALAVICVAESTVNAAPVTPNVTAVAPVKSAPVMVTTVPPDSGPKVGEMDETSGAGTYVNSPEATMALGPPTVDTVTSTGPVPDGASAVICVAESTVNEVAGDAPNRTAVAPVKFVSVIVTDVPPVSGPAVGAIDATPGAGTYVNSPAAAMALVPPIVIAVTSTAPMPDGATAVICVAESTVNDAADDAPNRTAVAPAKFDPVIVTEVPPVSGPVVGAIDATVGAGT